MSRSPIAVLDVDGTLVDSNYQHALAWYEAFRQSGIVLPVWRIHRLIGMGGEQLVPTLIGEERADEVGDEVNQGFQDQRDGAVIRGVLEHEH